MSRLYQLDTYFQKIFIVVLGSRIISKTRNWNTARDAFHNLTGIWTDEPTHDLATDSALLEEIISDAQ